MKPNKSYGRFTRPQWLTIAASYIAGSIVVAIFGLYGNPGSPAFIQGCVLEVAFALFSNWFQKPGFILYFLYTIIAIITPILLALSESILRSAGPAFFMYLITTSLMPLVRNNIPLPEWFLVPSYIPNGFKQVDYWATKGAFFLPRENMYIPIKTTAGLIYEDYRKCQIIVSGTMDELYPPTGISQHDAKRLIKGVTVFFDKQEPNLNYKGEPVKKFSLLIALWSERGYRFQIRMDGNNMDELEKMVASMIPDQPEPGSQKEGA